MPVQSQKHLGGDARAGAWILVAGACVGLACFLYFYRLGLTTAHYDAKAHLVVARGVLDSVTPGYEQMGANWLPLLHLLYLPFILVDLQYRTGLLPSLISVAAFALSGWTAYRLVLRVTGSVAAGVFSAALLFSNSNLQYLQSCPLTEPLSVLLLLLTIDSLIRWRLRAGESLPWAPAAWAVLGALCRYEGWYVFGGIMLLVGYDWWTGRLAAPRAARVASVYLGVFAVPVLAHFGYIYTRVGDSFFQRVARGNPDPYVTYKQPVLSALYHLGELVQSAGVIPLATAIAGIVYVLWRSERTRQFLPLFILWIPSLTNISALYWGLIYRVRYSSLLIPAIAVFGGLLISQLSRRRAFRAVCVVAMLLPWISWYFPREWRFHALAPGPGILILPAGALILFLAAEARKRYRWQLLALCVLAVQLPALSGEARPILEETGEHAFIEPERHQVLDYLEQHYDGSRILIDMSKLAPLAYDSQLALKNFVYNEGTGAYWHRTMRAPEAEVGWLCAETGDEVWRWLRDEPEKAARYSLVLRTEHFLLYRRKAGAGDPPDGQHP